MEVGVHAAEQLRLLPGQRVHAEPRLPVELDQRGAALGVDEPEGVDPEALHRAGTSAGSPRSDMSQIVWCCASVCSETKSQKVSCARLGLRDLAVRVRLRRVDDVGELDAVLDEEDRDVVADQVEGALRRCRTSPRSRGCRAPCRPSRASPATVENRTNTGVSTSFVEEGGRREVGGGAVADEHAVRAGAAGVHDPLGDALVVEVGDLLAQVVVLQQRRPARPGRAASGRCRAAAHRSTS